VPSKDRVKMRSLSWALQKHIGLLVKKKTLPIYFHFLPLLAKKQPRVSWRRVLGRGDPSVARGRWEKT
jgi:hypothetical protein